MKVSFFDQVKGKYPIPLIDMKLIKILPIKTTRCQKKKKPRKTRKNQP